MNDVEMNCCLVLEVVDVVAAATATAYCHAIATRSAAAHRHGDYIRGRPKQAALQ
jgi:hypothetical protein